MVFIFDGRAFAAEKEEKLKSKVQRLKEKGIVPHLVSIIVGDNPASRLYIALKQKAAWRIGAKLTAVSLDQNTSAEKVIEIIKKFNKDRKIQGIMVQLPLPGKLAEAKERIVNLIDPQKDVDGLRKDSQYIHPTAKAVMQIIEVAPPAKTICVIGEKGMVGSALIKEIKKTKLRLIKDFSNADILVSATGKPGLVTAGMVKEGAAVIDVGSPKGDVSPSVFKKAGFITPVPGGVGPVTISSLLENLIASAEKTR